MSTSSTEKQRHSPWADLRDLLGACREGLIILAIVLLLVTPGTVRNILERAGIRAIAGLEFQWEQLVQANSEAERAESELAVLSQQLALVEQQLGELSNGGSGLSSADLEDARRNIGQLRLRANSTEQKLNSAVVQQKQALGLLAPEQLQRLNERNKKAKTPPTAAPLRQSQLRPLSEMLQQPTR